MPDFCRTAIASQPQQRKISYPFEWTEPKFQFGQRVRSTDGLLCGNATGIITGLEWVAPDNYNVIDQRLAVGWHYDIWVDRNIPHWRIEPVIIRPEADIEAE